ncbi:MAG TPA: nuclear transport factor 2 family protein [Acidimicrobiales bacterium]|nr:nuclear transport factor 2 family protein [Acidimicrobiales bacterium]
MTAQPLSAEGRLGVMDLIASYAFYLDSCDIEAWLGNFLPDGVLESMNAVAAGQDQLRAWVNERIAAGKVAANPPQLVHFVGLPLVRGDSERCSARTYCVILDYNAQNDVRVPMVGRYEDTCVQLDGRWFFERRIIHGDLIGAERRVPPAQR